MTYFAHDGYLDTTCSWCGKPSADDDKVKIVQFSSLESVWMHRNCKRLNSEFSRRKQTRTSMPSTVLNLVRGEPSDLKPGTVGEARQRSPKTDREELTLGLPENLQGLVRCR